MKKSSFSRMKIANDDSFLFSSQKGERFGEKSLFNDMAFVNQYLLQQSRLFEERLKRLENVNFLRTTRPHLEEPDKQIEDLLQLLVENIKNLLADSEDMELRLNAFIDIKDTLASLNQEARKCGDVYLLRAIVVFYDSIKHTFAEELDERQLNTIKEVGNIISSKSIGKKEFKEIYKRLLDSGFQIIPEPAN